MGVVADTGAGSERITIAVIDRASIELAIVDDIEIAIFGLLA